MHKWVGDEVKRLAEADSGLGGGGYEIVGIRGGFFFGIRIVENADFVGLLEIIDPEIARSVEVGEGLSVDHYAASGLVAVSLRAFTIPGEKKLTGTRKGRLLLSQAIAGPSYLSIGQQACTLGES